MAHNIISNAFPATLVAGEQVNIFIPPDEKEPVTFNFHTDAPSVATQNPILLNGLSGLKDYERSVCVEITSAGITVKNTTIENNRLIHVSPLEVTDEDTITPIMQGSTVKIKASESFVIGFFTYKDDELAYMEITITPPTMESRYLTMEFQIVTG